MSNVKSGYEVKKSVKKPNKTVRSTAKVRESLAHFVDRATPRLTKWLNQVAEGIPKTDIQGHTIIDAQGSVVYLLKPDPMGAIKAVEGLLDYNLPRLQRSDISVIAQVEHNASIPFVERVGTMTTAEIKAMIAANMENGGVLDVESRTIEHDADPVPTWLQPPEDR